MKSRIAAIARKMLAPVVTPLVLLLLHATRPFVRLHIFELSATALGHLVIHIDLHLRRKSLGRYTKRDVFVFFCGPPANRFVQQLLARHVNMVTGKNANRLFGLVSAGVIRSRFYDTSLAIRGAIHRDFSEGHHDVRLPAEQISRGSAVLRRHGIGDGDWFVPIHSRDPGFHRLTQPQADRSYHDYRNSDINRYRKAIDHIADRGGYVIRMGKGAGIQLTYRRDRLIDLTSEHDDFMDAYLTSQCKFMISGNAGISYLPHLFNVPYGVTNMTPLGDMTRKRGTLYIPKLLRRRGGELLTFRQVQEMGLITGDADKKRERRLYESSTYDKLDVEWVENSEDDILDLCLDLFDLTEGRSPPSGAEAAQRLFAEAYFNDVPEIEYAGAVGPRFALKYADWI